jgi:hypothetical protein
MRKRWSARGKNAREGGGAAAVICAKGPTEMGDWGRLLVPATERVADLESRAGISRALVHEWRYVLSMLKGFCGRHWTGWGPVALLIALRSGLRFAVSLAGAHARAEGSAVGWARPRPCKDLHVTASLTGLVLLGLNDHGRILRTTTGINGHTLARLLQFQGGVHQEGVS